MYYIGIDLAWTHKNKSGICVFNEDQECIFLQAQVFSDQAIEVCLKDYKEAIVSIDAPLVIKNETGGRACDSLLMKTKIHNRHLKLYATSRSYMLRQFKDIRGENLSKLLSQHVLLETYPTGIYLSLFPDLYDNRYKLSSRNSLRDLIQYAKTLLEAIQGLGFIVDLPLDQIKTKVQYKDYEDQLDAILCGINSYYYHQNKYQEFSCDDNGAIVLPLK